MITDMKQCEVTSPKLTSYHVTYQGKSSLFTFHFTFSHLAGAFIQSDLQGCINIITGVTN